MNYYLGLAYVWMTCSLLMAFFLQLAFKYEEQSGERIPELDLVRMSVQVAPVRFYTVWVIMSPVMVTAMLVGYVQLLRKR